MAGITFAGEPVLDPLRLRESCLRQTTPLPLDPWFGRSNQFRSKLGCETGRGMILLSLRSLQKLYAAGKDNLPQHLIFHDGNHAPVTLKGIYLERYDAIAPSAEEDPDQPFYCRLVDRRHLFKAIPINKAYNVRSEPGGTFTTTTQNSGVDWTWSTMVGNIWGLVTGLGAFTSLPFTPHGTPEGWKFFSPSTAMGALSSVLTRLACALKFDHLTDTFSIVRIGSTNTQTDARILGLRNERIWDAYTTEPVAANYPAGVRVCFRKQPRPTDGATDVYTVDVADTNPVAGRVTGGVVHLWDDLTAFYDNSTALAARAAERAVDYFRAMDAVWADQETYVWREYQKDAINCVGNKFLGFTLLDNGTGAKTELFRGPAVDGVRLEDWAPENEAGALVSLTVVTNVCPVFATISAGVSGALQAQTGMEVESRTVWFPSGTMITSAECEEDPDDCCGYDDGDTPADSTDDAGESITDGACCDGVSGFGCYDTGIWNKWSFLLSSVTTLSTHCTEKFNRKWCLTYESMVGTAPAECSWGDISSSTCSKPSFNSLTLAAQLFPVCASAVYRLVFTYLHGPFSSSVETLATYELAAASFDCDGPNTFTLVSELYPSATFPDEITIYKGCDDTGGGAGCVTECCPNNPWATTIPFRIIGCTCGTPITGDIVDVGSGGGCYRWEATAVTCGATTFDFYLYCGDSTGAVQPGLIARCGGTGGYQYMELLEWDCETGYMKWSLNVGGSVVTVCGCGAGDYIELNY